jgi:Glycosyl transferases group 1
VRYASTYVASWHPEWSSRVRAVVTERDLASAAWTLACHRGPAILNGAVSARRAYIDLFAAGWLRHRGQPLIIADATWEPGSRRLDRLLHARMAEIAQDTPPIARRLVRSALMGLIDGQTVHYAVLSSDELRLLPETWGMDSRRVHFVPFCATGEIDVLSQGGGGVFAGGNSLRDYRALLDAVDSIAAPVTIATGLRPPAETRARFGAMPPQEYDRAALAADIVVVPLLRDTARSAGQQTYLNAMLRGQPVIVTRAPGVDDYVTDGQTGLIVDNEPRALAEAISGLFGNPGLAHRLGAAGRAEVLSKFQPRNYYDRLLGLVGRLEHLHGLQAAE